MAIDFKRWFIFYEKLKADSPNIKTKFFIKFLILKTIKVPLDRKDQKLDCMR